MIARVDATPGASQALAARAGEHQVTFEVPPKRETAFAAALLGAEPSTEATLVVRAASEFPPRRTRTLIARGNPETPLPADTTIVVEGALCEPLLGAALADGLDFWFAPTPGGFLVLADHDEYTTILAPRQGPVSRVAEALRLAGFRDVPGYRRKLR